MAKNIKCESCGANVIFNPDQGLLECEHCGSVKQLTSENKQMKRNAIVQRYHETYEIVPTVTDSQTYLCSSCGATVSFEENETKRRCPSCGDVTLKLNQKLIYIPDGIIPFTVSRDHAISIFQKWISTRKFAPNDLKTMAKLGKISGLYIPAWNFNFKLSMQYSADVTKTESMGERFFTRRFYVDDITEKTYSNVLLSANKRIEDTVVDGLEPYDITKIRPYSNEYVYGFSSLDTDENIHEKIQEVIREKEKNVESKIRKNLKDKYETIERLDTHSEVKNKTISYTFIPVWANHYTYNGKKYHCYINGQTGKTTGKSPKSFWKIFSLVAGIIGSIALASLLIF